MYLKRETFFSRGPPSQNMSGSRCRSGPASPLTMTASNVDFSGPRRLSQHSRIRKTPGGSHAAFLRSKVFELAHLSARSVDQGSKDLIGIFFFATQCS